MTKYLDGGLFKLIHDFVKLYLPKQRKVSPHTIRAYKNAIDLLLDYVSAVKNVPLEDVTFEMLTLDVMLAFLDSIEGERGCSVSTRNSRLAALRAFLTFCAQRDVTTIVTLKELKKIPVKKPVQVECINYMSLAAVSAIAAEPNTTMFKGLRDRMFMLLMYDLGARLQEMIDIRLCDIRISQTSTITIRGKGGKVRTVPIMEGTVASLRRYLAAFHPGAFLSEETPLFYTEIQGTRKPISASCVRLFLTQYAAAAREKCAEVPEKVHPHLWRHSRAMHLYQNGMDLTLVSQWLGHANLEVTLVYAHADPEHKRKAIAASTPPDSPLGRKLSPESFTVSDADTLKRLCGLK